MQLLKRKKTNSSFVISIESGVEEVQDVKVHEECDYLVDILTGKRSVSPDFCCRMLYMILCTCFTSESSQQRRSRGALQQRPQTSVENI
ncbi:AGAP010799-PA-like protein [Anopheles sinensis]|uniref:AGAP010799-PA-like protein n=1 Tax=Anopheles sinensis TaxID=74873 RepID=A0A084VB58_ANOSI|nr:AGAP010799-PA-like protein [Anopheles sinensis]